MDFETSLRVVTILSDALTTPQCVNEALLRVTEMTCVLMETQQTVIVLRDEEHQSFTVRTCVGMESQAVRVGSRCNCRNVSSAFSGNCAERARSGPSKPASKGSGSRSW